MIEAVLTLITVVIGAVGLFFWNRTSRRREEGERAKDTIEGFEKGQDAKRDRPSDPDDAVRRNDGQW